LGPTPRFLNSGLRNESWFASVGATIKALSLPVIAVALVPRKPGHLERLADSFVRVLAGLRGSGVI
jgi:hypothetical protein